MIREICKAGWLQQKVEKRSGAAVWSKKTIFLPEKWYVLCIHDDRSPFLEIYLNDEGVSRHEPLESLSLTECQFITTAIEDDRTFIIAFQNMGRNSLELAALSALERREWMEMLRFKLTRIGCLEAGSNIYTPFPVQPAANSSSIATLNDNSSVRSISLSTTRSRTATENIYEPPRRSIVTEVVTATDSIVMAPITRRLPENLDIYEPISHAIRSDSPAIIEENVQDEDVDDQTPVAPPRYSVITKPERPVLPPRSNQGGAPATLNTQRRTTRSEGESAFALYDVPSNLRSPLEPLRASPPRPSVMHHAAAQTNIEKYDHLTFDRETTIRFPSEETASADSSAVAANGGPAESIDVAPKSPDALAIPHSCSFDNAGFDADEDMNRRYANGPLIPASDLHSTEDDHRGPYSALPNRARMVPWSMFSNKPASPSTSDKINRANSNSPLPDVKMLNGRSRSRSVTSDLVPAAAVASAQVDDTDPPSPPTSPPPAPPLPLPNQLSIPVGSGRVMCLKETEVEKLRSEMESLLHVKAQVLTENVVNEHGQLMGLALVDLMGYVWIAGWLKRFTKQFSAGLHIGDRIDSIVDADGKVVAINSVARAEQILKECWRRRCPQVSLYVKRLPLGRVFVLKRAANGDSVGIALKAGKNEILAIEEGKAAINAGMRPQCKSNMNNGNTMVNYFITEVNGRPLNMFAKDHEAQKRLSAVGKEITVLVQPSDFVKELRKKLKHKKGYKDYVVG